MAVYHKVETYVRHANIKSNYYMAVYRKVESHVCHANIKTNYYIACLVPFIVTLTNTIYIIRLTLRLYLRSRSQQSGGQHSSHRVIMLFILLG